MLRMLVCRIAPNAAMLLCHLGLHGCPKYGIDIGNVHTLYVLVFARFLEHRVVDVPMMRLDGGEHVFPVGLKALDGPVEKLRRALSLLRRSSFRDGE